MVYAIPFGELQKIWAVIWGDVIFLFFLAFSAVIYLDIARSGSFSHQIKYTDSSIERAVRLQAGFLEKVIFLVLWSVKNVLH